MNKKTPTPISTFKEFTETELQSVDVLLNRMTSELQDYISQLDSQPYFIGIHSGGVWAAKALHQSLKISSQLGELDISFYRDDFEQKGLHPEVKPSVLPFDVENAHIILVDDIVMTGRTIRAALNEIFDYGRPKSITLVSLIELSPRELPIRPDICGQKLSLSSSQRVELSGPEPLSLRVVETS